MTTMLKIAAIACAVAVVAAGCGGSDDAAEPDSTEEPQVAIDYAAIGLWDDGPCDESLEPLVIGLQTTLASPVISLEDQALALEASAVAFNGRGGANGHCIEVVICDEKADPNVAMDCVRTLDEAGIVVTVNDSSAVSGPEIPEAFEAAGISRFALSPGTQDAAAPNSYPFDAGGLGSTLMMPQPLLDEGITKIAVIRVDLAGASALIGLLDGIYEDQGYENVADVAVAAGTTDYSQFIIAAQDAGAEGIVLPLGGQEAIQVLKAAQQLGSDLVISSSLGTFAYDDLADLGDFAENLRLNASSIPATFDSPVMDALVADLEASGEPVLQRTSLKTSPTRSWIGLYALLDMIRTSGTEDFSRANLTSLIEASGPIDMLDLTADWTPLTENPGMFPRTGNGHYAFWKWDTTADFGGTEGNLVKTGEANYNETVCGSLVGADASTC